MDFPLPLTLVLLLDAREEAEGRLSEAAPDSAEPRASGVYEMRDDAAAGLSERVA